MNTIKEIKEKVISFNPYSDEIVKARTRKEANNYIKNQIKNYPGTNKKKSI